MIPYANFTYFGLLLYPIVPTIIFGLAGRFPWRWVLLTTLAVLAIQYTGTLHIQSQQTIQEIWVVVGYALIEWVVAIGFVQARARTKSRAPFYIALTLGLLPLLGAKFLPLFGTETFVGFLGISYVTFRSLDVIFGIQDRIILSVPIDQYIAYLLFFPTISAGPIDRYRRFAADWKRSRSRDEFLQDLDAGIHRIFTGFLYKFIIAYLIKRYWLDPVADHTGFINTLSYMYAYSFYLFFDFAGYSAFAIGFSYLFGIHTPGNFRLPFLASDIRDFWNRWHISLSSWFRDHVYMRFVLVATKGRWFKHKYLGSYLGFFLSFGLMGLWHGTALHYIVYGLYHGTLLTGYDIFSRWNKQHKLWSEGLAGRIAGICITFNIVCFGFLIFSGHLDAPAKTALSQVAASILAIYRG